MGTLKASLRAAIIKNQSQDVPSQSQVRLPVVVLLMVLKLPYSQLPMLHISFMVRLPVQAVPGITAVPGLQVPIFFVSA